MKSGLNALKNMIWALGILVVLLALLVGLVVSLASRNYGERPDGTLILGQNVAESVDGIDNAGVEAAPGAPGGLIELPATQDGGIESVFNFTYLCDSTITGINDYSASYGGNATAQIWTDDGSGISAANAATTTIIYPSDGSMITPSNAAMVYQPKRLVIYIGSDDLENATEESFKAGYEQLIKSIKGASEKTNIICCSIASVSSTYPASNGLTKELIAQANTWIQDVCVSTGSYYADLASLLNDENGYLNAEYASLDGRTLNSAGVHVLVEYFRFHGI